MTIATHTDFAPEFAGIIANLALNFALLPDTEVVAAIKYLRAGFVQEFQNVFADSEDEAKQLANDLLTAVVVKRHELERYGSPVLSHAIH